MISSNRQHFFPEECKKRHIHQTRNAENARAESISYLVFCISWGPVCKPVSILYDFAGRCDSPASAARRALTYALSRAYIRARAETTSYAFCRRPRAIRAVSFALFCPGDGRRAASKRARTRRSEPVRRAYLHRYARKAFRRTINIPRRWEPRCAPLSELNYRLCSM